LTPGLSKLPTGPVNNGTNKLDEAATISIVLPSCQCVYAIPSSVGTRRK